MLEGKNVDLKIMEREDLSVLQEWDNNPKFMGEYEPLRQETRTELEKTYDNRSMESESSGVFLLNFNRIWRKCRLEMVWKSEQP